MASLLDRLGGSDGLAVVIGGLVARLYADARFTKRLDGIARMRHQADMVDCFAVLLDGDHALPVERQLAMVLLGLQLDGVEVEAFLGYLAETLAAAGVGGALNREVVAQIAVVRRSLV
jgi:hypothetical protein